MSKSTKMNAGGNIITNNAQSNKNNYISGSGVGAQPIALMRAKRRLSLMCFPCKK
jgi:hypothetical protein